MMLYEVDPNLVRPGWTPLVVLLLLGVALFFLGRSMLKQFRKIDVPADHDPAAGAAADPGTGTHRPTDERTITGRTDHPIPDLRTGRDGSGETAPPDRH
ncbi:MAG TPA: hypothetical protein VEX66_16290 [Microlunatus sp.]|jgi:hypothetical protein|nr:hypothetical protein [Microlunatus sp.]